MMRFHLTGYAMATTIQPGRPTPELLAALRQGKAMLRRERYMASLPEKVRAVIELQRDCLPLLARRRALRPWERVWDTDT
jgi:hypothetical protein